MLTTEKILKMNAPYFAEKNVMCVKETANLKTINNLMINNREKIIWVTNVENKLVGLITGEKLVNFVLDKNKEDATAKDIMDVIDLTKTDAVAKDSDNLDDIIEKLRRVIEDRDLSALPLIDSEGSIKGQVTSKSIADNLDKLIEVVEMTS